MKSALRPLTAAAVLGAAVVLPAAHAAMPDPKGWNGTPVMEGHVDRVIEVGPGTRVVNVDENQIVRFVVHGAGGRDDTFMWQFNGGRAVIPLASIAPDGVVSRAINVYVAPDPFEGSMAD